MSAVDEYRRRYESLREVASRLASLLSDLLAGIPRVDRIEARAKEPDSFAEKAGRMDENGNPKYRAPLTEIQDQIGARIVVFFRSDLEPVRTRVDRYFQPIEEKLIVPESLWEFGYFGQHLILALPGDVVPKGAPGASVPRFFELQIKTLFQHAWSQANHDLGYKPPEPLSNDQQRMLAFTAAQAWGADRIFEDLQTELRAAAGYAKVVQ